MEIWLVGPLVCLEVESLFGVEEQPLSDVEVALRMPGW